jgi:hypothetical protein
VITGWLASGMDWKEKRKPLPCSSRLEGGRQCCLVGDPQPLDQPHRGVHPPGAEASALYHLLNGRATITEDQRAKGRLNVAISRAQCLTVLVACPALFEVQSKTVRQIELANAFCTYLERVRLHASVILTRFCRDSYRNLRRIKHIITSFPTANHSFIGIMRYVKLVRLILWDS